MSARLASLVLCAALAVRAQTPAPDVDATVRGPAIGEEELAPYFTTPQLQGALADLLAGRAAQALKKLPLKPTAWPQKWLRAQALKAAGQPHPARALFEQLTAGPLADRALHLAALCAIDEGDAAAAERLLGQVSLRYVDADQVLLERTRQTMKLRVAGPATASLIEAVLAPIFDGTVRADVASAHLLAGDAQLAAGAKEAARVHYRAAWVEHPLSAAADSARDRERQLAHGAPVPPLMLLKRAETLLDAHRNRDALEQLSRIPVPSLCTGGCPGDRTPAGFLAAAISALAPSALPEEHQPTPEDVAKIPTQPADALACRVKLDQGRAYRKEHDYHKARAALAPVVLRCADPDVRARSLYLLAQLEAMANKPDAGPLWEALARKYPKSSLADDALFNQSIAARRAGDLNKERALLQDLVDHHPDSDLRNEAIFRLFYSRFSEGKGRQGVVYLDQLAALPDPDGADEERARYWRARVLSEPLPGETATARAAALEAARADLNWLVKERPLTYHGLLAHSLLPPQELQLPQAAPQQESLHAGALSRDPHLLAAVELLRLGMKPEAARELTAVDRSPSRAAGDAGQEALTLIAELYARAGDFRNAHALVRTELRGLLRRPGSPLAVRAESLAYPLAFRDQIAKVSRSASIPPDLLQALMREESALDPKALSSTGALGLTQVMPATARTVAKRLNLRGYQTQQLLDPETNIRIGGAYLGELYAHFQHPALALASYNAGPGAVAGWLKGRPFVLDAFVEEIPLDETRGYVKRCLRSFAAYQFLYSNGRVPPLGQIAAQR
ncbi:MAG TPA: transglycosylase SLT domain-containing protein [Myxococcales bacterium]|jgi:soluble lytic murein transglycosylase|nr:transglycosylase SLT domain-containing protein [Myxococcales bacterium]